MEKEYLGDGVYVKGNEQELILTTENGISMTNEIYLDWNIQSKLLAFICKLHNLEVIEKKND